MPAPIQSDLVMSLFDDQAFYFANVPPSSISGQSIFFTVTKNFGSPTALIQKFCSSGFNGVSGITIIDGVQGTYSVAIDSIDTSGFDSGAYAYSVARADAGFTDTLREGYVMLLPTNFPGLLPGVPVSGLTGTFSSGSFP